MKILLVFLAGAVVGCLAGYFVGRRTAAGAHSLSGSPSLKEGEKKETLIARQKREKEKDKEQIYGLLETNTRLTVGQVEQMLGIPESSATRYFDELEKEGKVRQVGATGAGVHYESI